MFSEVAATKLAQRERRVCCTASPRIDAHERCYTPLFSRLQPCVGEFLATCRCQSYMLHVGDNLRSRSMRCECRRNLRQTLYLDDSVIVSR